MTQIKPNSNFTFLGGVSVHDNKDAIYQEYRNSWIKLPEKFVLRDFPMHLDIESTSCCNLNCVFCDKLPLLKKDQFGYLDFGLYKKIIDEAVEHRLWGLKLSYRGEPLLHKEIVRMVSYAKKKGILDVYFNTNGMLLNEDMSERLIDAGLDRISISVEGIDKKEFEKHRMGANFDTILANINSLKELRKKNGVSHPKIRVQTVCLPGINLELYKRFWSPVCDEVAAIDYKDESTRVKGIVQDWACPQLWQRMTIEWDGTILCCNNDDLHLLKSGNAKEKSIYDSWHSLKIQEARCLHQSGRSHEVLACNGCPWRTAQINKIKSDIF